MKTQYSALFLVAIVLSMAVVIQIDSIQSADAVKAQGTKSSKYGMETKNKVCGDRLCTPEDFTSKGERKSLPALSDSSITSQMAMAKMDRLFELHRMQLLSAWDSLNDSEKSHMMKMFDRMYEKMQSMDFKDHMKHMKKMMSDKHHEKMMDGCNCGDGQHGCNCGDGQHGCNCGDGQHGCNCGDGQHGCNCGDGQHGCNCGDGQHGCNCGDHSMTCSAGDEGCTCSEDGVCNCGEECTCASCH